MASNQTSATSLLALTRQRAFLPVQGGPPNVDILRDLNAELLVFVVPVLTGIGEEFFVAPSEFDTVSGTREYDIPADSIASKIRDVQVVDPANPDNWLSLAHEEPERAAAYAQASGRPVAYFVRNGVISLLPAPTAVWSMRIMYYRRPREIVNTGYSTATDFELAGGDYTVQVADTDGMVDGYFDILDPTTYAILAENMYGTVDEGQNEITFEAALLTDAQTTAMEDCVDKVFIASGTAPVADVPPEAAILLALRAATIYLQEAADPRMAQAFSEIERVKNVLQSLFAPRTSGRPRKVVNTSGPGWGSARWTGRAWLGSGN